jgi:hypothetical protein
MAGTPAAFTESQALKNLAQEQWNREGESLVSQNTYTAQAVDQYREPLSARTRERIGFSAKPSDLGGGASNAQKLVLNAAAAERFFPKGALNIVSDSPEREGRGI